jgi:hypothetical protein
LSKTEDDIQQRKQFYTNPDVARHISRDGIPKTKEAMNTLISAGGMGLGTKVDLDLFNCLSFVVFAVHPQQINIRDKSNGKIITTITR